MYFSLFLSRGDLRIPGLPRCRVRHFAGFSHVVFHAGFYLKGKDSVALLSTYKVLKQSPYLDALPSRMLRIVIRYAPIKAIQYTVYRSQIKTKQPTYVLVTLKKSWSLKWFNSLF